ncbi:uncharacterized protein LOC122525388 [Polistes fuscatus]|uniref:uncharacterized protein LOC122525388 n=1 Tax=Polistes fuscatus TaxID=30207 RepID=UPI001CA7C3A1|nr:uncharacterized protein LOC122525388 [Polistes fuscatus]
MDPSNDTKIISDDSKKNTDNDSQRNSETLTSDTNELRRPPRVSSRNVPPPTDKNQVLPSKIANKPKEKSEGFIPASNKKFTILKIPQVRNETKQKPETTIPSKNDENKTYEMSNLQIDKPEEKSETEIPSLCEKIGVIQIIPFSESERPPRVSSRFVLPPTDENQVLPSTSAEKPEEMSETLLPSSSKDFEVFKIPQIPKLRRPPRVSRQFVPPPTDKNQVLPSTSGLNKPKQKPQCYIPPKFDDDEILKITSIPKLTKEALQSRESCSQIQSEEDPLSEKPYFALANYLQNQYHRYYEHIYRNNFNPKNPETPNEEKNYCECSLIDCELTSVKPKPVLPGKDAREKDAGKKDFEKNYVKKYVEKTYFDDAYYDDEDYDDEIYDDEDYDDEIYDDEDYDDENYDDVYYDDEDYKNALLEEENLEDEIDMKDENLEDEIKETFITSSDDERLYQSPDCKINYAEESVFKKKQVIGRSERFPCPKCSSTFCEKFILNRHLNYECGQEPRFQ